jgi:transposase
MISPETRVQIRRYFYAEHWKIGTIARELGVHPDTVRQAVESERFHRGMPLGPSLADPYLEFVRQTLDRHPRLTATRIYQMIRERGYSGSVVQLRRVVARLRPARPEPFLRLHMFPAEHYGELRVMVRTGGDRAFGAGPPLTIGSSTQHNSVTETRAIR